MALSAEVGGDALAVVALDLDDIATPGASGRAEPPELACARLEPRSPLREPVDDGDDLAAAPRAVEEDPHDAVGGRSLSATRRRHRRPIGARGALRRRRGRGVGRVHTARVLHAAQCSRRTGGAAIDPVRGGAGLHVRFHVGGRGTPEIAYRAAFAVIGLCVALVLVAYRRARSAAAGFAGRLRRVLVC